MKFKDLINVRQSVRAYEERVPSKEELVEVLEAGCLAPSAVNFQPYTFVVVTEKAMMDKLHDCYHREWFNSAPACIVVIGEHEQSWHRAADNKDFCDVDAAIAIDHLTLRAADLGLGTCWVCNFEVSKVVDLFKLGATSEPIALIPIGYPADGVQLESKEKKRKKLEDIVKWL